MSRYVEKAGVDPGATTHAKRFAGVEIMRRLIGVAQLPLECGIQGKRDLLLRSRELVLTP